MSVRSNIRPINHDSGDTTLLRSNPDRVGFIVENQTNTIMYIAFSERQATKDFYSISLPAQASYEHHEGNVPKELRFTGDITFRLDNANSGKVMITEFLEVKTND